MLLAWVASLACSHAAQAGTLPGGFQESTAFTGLSNPTALSFTPDGRVFVGEKSGVIKVFDGLGDATPTTFADLSTETYNFWDRGLLGLTVDPLFPARPYVYALYTLDAEPGGGVPRWGTAGVPGDPCPNPPGATGDGCVVTGRLARLTVSGDVMSAKTDLISDWCQQYPSHSMGDLGFGSDGALYVTAGDGASFNFVDWGQDGNPVNPCGDPPGGIGGEMSPPAAEGGALRSQDARTTSDPTGLNGSLLRVDPDTGEGIPGNPFASSPDANQRRIAAFGFRNPFRFTVRPGTDEVWAGDVGWGGSEEINRVPDPSDSEADNLGWPCYEGNSRGSYEGANLSLCDSLYTPGDDAVTPPYYAYSHSDKLVSGESCPSGSSSIAGLSFYENGPFPDPYDDALFFADYSRDCIWAMLPGGNGLPDPASIQTFDTEASNPVDLEFDQGELFYANLDGGTIQRLRYVGGNQQPTAVAAASPSSGPAPLDVQLDAAGSSDPDDAFNTLSFAWDADDDGQFDDGNQVTLDRTYPAGAHTATVRVTDPSGASDTDSVSIQTDNSPPVAQILTPAAGTTWEVDEVVGFSGSATDADETLPASAFDWEIVVNHCPSNCHQHVEQQLPDRTSGSFSAPDHEYPSSLIIRLTVTDAGGLTDTESVEIDPRTVDISLESAPGGLRLGLNSAPAATAPVTGTVIKGSRNTVIAPTPQSLAGESYEFGTWSDGGAAAHSITADQNMTLEAAYNDVTPPAPPQLTTTNPGSPANDENPEVRGTTGAGSPTLVKLYTNGACSGPPAATGSPSQFAAGGITVAVPPDATTRLAARSTDAAANDSACSAGLDYREDSTGPQTVITGGPRSKVVVRWKRGARASKSKSKSRRRVAAITINFSASEAASAFGCRLDKGPYAPCSSPLVLSKLKGGSHTFRVRASDAVGNVDVTPARHRFRVVKRKAKR